jgi:hypothetical protein
MYVQSLARAFRQAKTRVLAIKLDIKKSFDFVSWEILLDPDQWFVFRNSQAPRHDPNLGDRLKEDLEGKWEENWSSTKED